MLICLCPVLVCAALPRGVLQAHRRAQGALGALLSLLQPPLSLLGNVLGNIECHTAGHLGIRQSYAHLHLWLRFQTCSHEAAGALQLSAEHCLVAIGLGNSFQHISRK